MASCRLQIFARTLLLPKYNINGAVHSIKRFPPRMSTAAGRCRLTYFQFRALGEPIRMMLTYAQMPYDEERIERFGEEWPKRKPEFPMGQLPVLDIDGVRLHQSKAICRYLAKRTPSLYGDTDAERAEIDAAADIVYDLIMKMRVLRDIDDEAAKEKKYEEFKATAIPHFLGNLDNMAKANRGYLACGKLSWVDFYFAGSIEYLEFLCRMKFTETHRNLQRVVENVRSLPQLETYMKTRPSAEM